jgi:rhodanese-related sulfurtransferase
MKRNWIIQAAVLIALATVLAIVSNAFASRQRKLVLPGYYPNALKVPAKTVPAPPPPPPAATVAQSPAPGNPPIVVPTATIERPAGKPEPEKPKPVVKPEPAPIQKFPPHPDKPYVEISGEDVQWLHSRGVLILDARRTSVYEEGHIAGARPFSVWESDVDEKVNKLFEERGDPQQQLQPIVIYCSGGACEDSHMLAQKLWGIQFNNVLVYKDGYPDWVKRGGAVKTGANP